MKECWIHLRDWDKDQVTEALEAGADGIITEDPHVKDIRELGIIAIASPKEGDLKIPDDFEIIVIKNKDDEQKAAESLKHKKVAVKTTDWDIIPIENLIPVGGERLYTFVRNLEEARLATTIMEKGVAGVILETDDPSVISDVVKHVKSLDTENVTLEALSVKNVKAVGMADRVCVDTCANLKGSQGMLVGNSSQGLFLVHAENIENPYVAPRPFRVNAGAVHSYIRVPENRTRYLGELASGDPVLVVDHTGKSITGCVGRSKIEKRPMLLIEAEDSEGNSHSVILQNAETIRLTDTEGLPISVVSLKKGDKVLGYTEKTGRHFGMAVDESIEEQ